ncbi:MAG: MmcQ/YjbR family DNA-binding protein [Clostridia bacterium]|nr:MmcQ/YjbR family DNA-binding protein [Clostridia bacterium]
MKSLRDKIYSYVKDNYKSEIEYLWKSAPNFAVFRRNDNKKWYGIIMDIPYQKINVSKDGVVDILNVKIDDWFLKDSLLQEEGFYPAYHMNKEKWLSVLLDGKVNFEKICQLIDISYQAVVSKKFTK